MLLSLPSQKVRILLLLAAITFLSSQSGLAQAKSKKASSQKIPSALAARTASVDVKKPVAAAEPVLTWEMLNSQDVALMADFVIHTSEEHGLFLTATEAQSIQQLRTTNPDSARASLTPLFVSIARQLHGGRLVPTDVAKDIRFSRKNLSEAALTRLVVDAAGSREALTRSLAPRMPEYRMLVKMLKQLQQVEAQQAIQPLVAIPAIKKPLKTGAIDAAVPAIKARLVSLGFPITNMDNQFDAEMLAAVNDVQRQMKIKPDGIISPKGATLRYLNISIADRRSQVRADLEKMRWLPQDPGQRYIFVNLAFSSLLLMDFSRPNPVVFNFKTINGRAERKTPSMVDKIYQVILNPFWTVPPTVFLKDKVKAIRQLSSSQIEDYFEKNNYSIVSENFRQRYSPSRIDWDNVTSSRAGFYIRQSPNYSNALGVVKFSMTNGEAIYLHDTGDRELFADDNRLLSSGCVRVEKPIELAEYILAGTAWDRAAIENHVVKPGEVLDRATPIDLKTSANVPVYMLPVTSHLASDGIMRFTDDVYGHNASIKEMTSLSLF